jgi:molecular chaperone DnaJ
MRDFYEVLGVAKDATASEIKKAYRSLAMEHHPDRNPGDKEAEERFKEASNAYKVLSDPEQRARYDQFGHAGVGRSGGGFEGFRGVDDIFSAFGDLFGDFFGGGRARGPRRGADLQVRLPLSFAEAVHGASKEVEVKRKRPCETCEGSGAEPGSDVSQCSVCNGQGQVMHSQGFFMIQTTCPNCRGEGQIIESKCKTCHGSGTELESSTLTVSVPAGVDSGQTLRLAHKGEAAPRGGRPGHLYVVIEVEDDERFLRQGENVLCPVPISYLHACLGGDAEVPTLEDECEGTTTLEIKPGTQPGDVVVKRGQGIPVVGGRGRGDLVYQLNVEIPKKLSSKERELLKSLAEESGIKVGDGKRGIFGGRRKR